VHATTFASRTLTLRVPIATEEERALFQRRLALTGLVVFALGFGFFVITLGLIAALAPARLHHLVDDFSTRIHMGTSFAAGGLWLALRRGKASVTTLSVLDFVIGIGLCLGWVVMACTGQIPVAQRPENIALLSCTLTLAVRAALIPSTPARTVAIGTLGIAPIVPFTSALYANVELPPVPVGSEWLSPTSGAAVWCALAVTASAVISQVVYGLRQQVRKAMQLGQYLLEEKIGEGGMGVVYRASHAMLRRPTAIKLLSGTASHATARFEREVQITARLTHPNTIAVFDYGRTPEGVFYYAMEYLEGTSLEDLVADHGAQPLGRVAHILLQMCGALGEAHDAGLVHRDIKPANAMLTERGGVPDVVKVLDFGLVKENVRAADATATDPSTTMMNTIVGTPHYMAPEAIVDPTKIDARADLYAVGATAFYLLTGDNVFDGANLIEICSQHIHEKPLPPSSKRADVPKALDEVILACLAKQPADRPKNAKELAARIRACNLGEWSAEDAQAWWSSRSRTRRPTDTSREVSEVSPLGKTIAVALDGRKRA
jgi:hypothetical protein